MDQATGTEPVHQADPADDIRQVLKAVHRAALAAYSDDYGDDDAQPWSSRDIADRVMSEHLEDDSLAIRVLAGRIAKAPAPSASDPLHMLKDLGNALGAFASATSTIIIRWHDVDELEQEQIDEYTSTVRSLIAAADGLKALSGWF